jgi:molybdopterin-containing oxidoreductase family membrane subunit
MTAPAASGKKLWTGALWLLWAACLGLGAIGIYQRIAYGHMPAGYGSYVPWGLWIAIYFHGVGIAGGAFVVAALGYILNLPGFRHPAALRAAIVLAFASMIPALMAVWLDLGHMERAFSILTSPSFTSMMAFNAWMYNAFMGVAALCWFISYRRQGSGWLKPLLCLGVLIAIVFPSQSGAFFGVVDAKPYWHSALMPIMFLASAITAGSAMLLLIRGIIGVDSPAGHGDATPEAFVAALSRLRKVVLAGLIAYFLFEFAEFSIVLWNTQTHAPAIELVLFGPYWWVFWIIHLAIGGVAPLLLLLTRRPGAWMLASLLVAVTFISTRLNVLVPGQAVGEIKGLQEAFSHPRLSYTYHATTMEYLVGLFLVGVGMTVYFIGRRISKMFAARAA